MLASVLLIILLSSVGAAVVIVVLFTVRRRSLTRAAGAFDCSAESEDGTWRLGVAVFGVSALDWYPVFSLRPHPSMVLPRSDLEIVSRGAPSDGEQYSLLPDAQVISCYYDVHQGSPKTIRLGLDAEALSGFSSWLESAPPGANHTMGRFT